jgi:hypothetical protein
MRAYISCDERYPDYSIEEDSEWAGSYDRQVEIPKELYRKFKVIEELYNEIQDQLEDLFNSKESDGFL